MLKKPLFSLLVALALAAGLSACTQHMPTPASRFVLLDGSTKTSADLQGKVTLVNFWATSCTTCVAEMPMLAATQRTYGAQGYQTLAVAMQYDPVPYVLNFAQSRQLPFDVAIDNTGQLAADWGNVRATPTSYLVNRRGEIVKRYVGQINEKELHQAVQDLLKAS